MIAASVARRTAAATIRTGVLVLATVAPSPAAAGDAEATCPTKFYRLEEDCRNLAGHELTGVEVLRFLPIGPDASLSLGGEARWSVEGLAPPNFGIRKPPDSMAEGWRGLFDLDFRITSGPRVFVQLLSAGEGGRQPVERPFDRDTLDLAQAFVELPTNLAEIPITLRVGRQELDLQGNRLVGVRDLANVRRAFDLVFAEVRPAGFVVDAFGGRPVLLDPGLFNDRSDPQETFAGTTIEHPVLSEPGSALAAGIFAFRRTRDQAVYAKGTAPDDRDTFGARLHGNVGAFDLALQAALQRGRFGQFEIDASGIAMDIGWRFANMPWQPRLGLSGGRASGDKGRGDSKLGTFDPVYPNLSYFTDASPIYPGNSADLEPNLTVTPMPGVTVQGGVDMIWRVSNQDAIYAPPGVPLVAGTGNGPSHVASLPYLRASFAPDPHWEVDLSYVKILAGALLQQAGGRSGNYFRAAVTARF
jgi:hypothetical protein